MDIKKVTGVYFSPAGSTKTVVETTVDELARLFKAESRYISLNTPSDRAQEYQFALDELVVFGCPVYAGRLPNKIRRTLLAACTVRVHRRWRSSPTAQSV